MTRTTAVRVLAVALLIVEVVGVVCQFVQTTDPRPPLSYFTVDSAILSAAAAACTLIRPASCRLFDLRGPATVGVVLSGIVFAAVIAPSTATGTWIQPWDDTAVRIANVVLHGVAPWLALSLFFLAPAPHPVLIRRRTLAWLSWPILYFATMLGVSEAGVAVIPYDFLRPSRVGWLLAVLAGLVTILVLAGLSALLLWGREAPQRRRRPADLPVTRS